MAIPRRFLPPTAMLAAFEAAARSGSFTHAARELNLTQSAVSRQIRSLEERLGADLFVRERQSVRLTAAGTTYAREIRDAIKHIGAASMAIRANPRMATLNLAVLPTFAGRWLMPRINRFLDAHPDTMIHFSSRITPFEFETEPFDAAIHFGQPAWMGAETTPLMGETVVALTSPQLASAHRYRAPEDLLDTPLLILASRPDAWERWFLAQGVVYDAITGPLFDNFETMSRAAMAGLGIALLPRFLFNAEITAGQLVPVTKIELASTERYHFVWPQSRRDNPTMIHFRDWIVAEAALEPAVTLGEAPEAYPQGKRKKVK